MAEKILYMAIDVDDKAFTGYAISEDRTFKEEFRLKPNVEALDSYIKRFLQKGWIVRVCYESTYLGFSLQRDLAKLGIHCDVIASSLIPEKPGNRRKTDRLDARKLVELYANGLLTNCHIPTEEEENVRNLMRSRKFVVTQISDLKKHILSLCRARGIDYRGFTKNPRSCYWTNPHLAWLNAQTKSLNPILADNIRMLLQHYDRLMSTLQQQVDLIREIANSDRYKKAVQSLSCFRGIDTISAMVLISEIADPLRFANPTKLTAYAGMAISEYSSGGKEMKFSITKMGNSFIRTAATEICQFALSKPQISKALKERRKKADPQAVAIADRCMQRLHKKGWRLINREKHRNKAIMACARELLGFVWEALTLLRKAEKFA